MQPGLRRRLHRRRSHLWLRLRQGAAVRTVDDRIPTSALRRSKTSIMEEANKLTIGPMGFGGRTSLIGCKIGVLNRLPASFFVSVAYTAGRFVASACVLDATSGAITSWLYRDGTTASSPLLSPEAVAAGFPRTGREARSGANHGRTIRLLKVGDVVLVSAHVHRPRRRARAPDEARAAGRSNGGVLYHCGPVVEKTATAGRSRRPGRRPASAKALSGGDRRALRFPRRHPQRRDGRRGRSPAAGIRGGVSQRDWRRGAVLCRCIDRVAASSSMEFGTPEAMWHLQVRDFPAIVTMDAHGFEPPQGR